MHPYFVRPLEIDVAESISFQQRQQADLESENIKAEGYLSDHAEVDSELNDLLQEQHNTKFAAPLPFWRLCVLTERNNPLRLCLTFVWHHALRWGVRHGFS